MFADSNSQIHQEFITIFPFFLRNPLSSEILPILYSPTKNWKEFETKFGWFLLFFYSDFEKFQNSTILKLKSFENSSKFPISDLIPSSTWAINLFKSTYLVAILGSIKNQVLLEEKEEGKR